MSRVGVYMVAMMVIVNRIAVAPMPRRLSIVLEYCHFNIILLIRTGDWA
jgi:hypothetical protein